jgi:RsiW-degrading membrane proteinase PrsW (M82 family)
VQILVDLLVGLAPVLAFLAVLVWLQTHKLVAVRVVMGVLAAGAGAAGACWLLNGAAMSHLAFDFDAYSRFVGPFVEELAKGIVVVALIRMNRMGFLVDAAILGFGIGAGFAVVENAQYASMIADAGLGTWIVRGFGTAIMHGSTTAIFAVMGLAFLERRRHLNFLAFAPGYAIAVLLHAAYNQGFLSPKLSTLAVLVVAPPIFYAVFARSESTIGDWLGRGFDADAETLELIDSGRFSDSPIGRYLRSLRERFEGPIVADILCYLRLHTELALRAKGVLMMRENGFDVPLDDATRAKFEEIRYLEKSIGRAALLAVQPMLHLSRRDLWQMQLLGR